MTSTQPAGVANAGRIRRAMRMRDPSEAHRASTPLELFLDLCFVVAVSQAAGELRQAVTAGHLGTALVGYAAVFFAIWWAWMNFTWFASAFDTDDIPYRLLTLVQMAGVLILAAGVPSGFQQGDFTIIVIGYVVMRLAMITQWLRAAVSHDAARPAALRYALGIGVVQLGWIAQLWAPAALTPVAFIVLVIAELAVPVWGEARGRTTRWHPAHIADRYGGFTIIVLGEVVLATLVTVQSTLHKHGLSVPLIMIAVGALVLVFSLWWIYFTGDDVHLGSLPVALIWGYGHYFVFAATAAIAAGLDVAAAVAVGDSPLSSQAAAWAVGIPVVIVFLVLIGLNRLTNSSMVGQPVVMVVGAAAVIVCTLSQGVLGLGGDVLGVGLMVAATLAVQLLLSRAHNPT